MNRLDYLNGLLSSANELEAKYGKECSDNFMRTSAMFRRQAIATDLSYDNKFLSIFNQYSDEVVSQVANNERNKYLMDKTGLEREDLSLRFYDC